MDIKRFDFNQNWLKNIEVYRYWKDRPVVYFLKNNKEAYVWESINVYNRCKQHMNDKNKSLLKQIYVITDAESNKSATLDIESDLIQYLAADWSNLLLNSNGGLKNHEYYNRKNYKAKFELIWDYFLNNKIVKHTLFDLKNSDLFKFSPYKSLTSEQKSIVNDIVYNMKHSTNVNQFLIHWKPWTWKTILWVYLVKFLKEQLFSKDLEIWIVIPMTWLRKTIKKIFSKIKNLSSSMVLWPHDVVKKRYDILIVDEAHRLKRRKNITNFQAFDNINKKLSLWDEWNQLNWINYRSKFQIFLYDEWQSILPADIDASMFRRMKAKEYSLQSQMRLREGEWYLDFIDDLFNLSIWKNNKKYELWKYKFKIFDNIWDFKNNILMCEEKYKLSRMVAWYAWPWKSKWDKSWNIIDIKIESESFCWNSVIWWDRINSNNAINEVWCIHTVQGYDLNYVWVIIWNEIWYDNIRQKIIIRPENYHDRNWKRWINKDELFFYIINIYKTLLSRWILWTYIYVIDKNLKEYIKNSMKYIEDN